MNKNYKTIFFHNFQNRASEKKVLIMENIVVQILFVE